jgi:hypothetical protein
MYAVRDPLDLAYVVILADSITRQTDTQVLHLEKHSFAAVRHTKDNYCFSAPAAAIA